MKNQILVISAVLAVGCLVIAVLFSQKVGKVSKDLELERYNRMMTEEKLEKATAKMKSLENDSTNMQNQSQGLQVVLEKERQANDKLRSELEKTSKLKDVLEKELKEALVEPPAPSPVGK